METVVRANGLGLGTLSVLKYMEPLANLRVTCNIYKLVKPQLATQKTESTLAELTDRSFRPELRHIVHSFPAE
jgi:hypothetical protein